MPIQDRYNKGDVLFAQASAECVVRHRNNDPGVDPDTGNVHGGICSGITSAWIVSLLNADRNPDAIDTQRFAGYFDVLRFQGAYFKELHGQADTHLDKLAKAMEINGALENDLTARPLREDQLPAGGWWAAYVSLRGHAVGIGEYQGCCYIVEPNFGLYVYASKQAFLPDLNQLAESYMTKKGITSQARFLFFKPEART